MSDQEESDAEDDSIIPNTQMSKGSRHTQEAVDQRLSNHHPEQKRYVQVTKGCKCQLSSPMAPELPLVRHCQK